MVRVSPARRSSEDGIGLIEMMISIMLIGLILAGLAASLITTLRATRIAEKTSVATALHQELLERTVALPWARIGIYTDDPDFTATVTEDESGNTYDTVALPAESPQDPRIMPRVQVLPRSGTDFTVTRDVYWVDASGDGIPEAKRLRTVITWVDPAGPGTATFFALRLPTGLEASDGFEVLLFTASPNVIQLGEDGRTTQSATLFVNTSQPSLAPVVTLEKTDGSELTLSGWTASGDATSWQTTLPTGSGPFPGGDQLAVLEISSMDVPPSQRSAALTMTFAPHDEPVDNTSFTIQQLTSNTSPAGVTNQREICPPKYEVRVHGFLPDGDGVMHDTVEIQYEYWAATGTGNQVEDTKTTSARKFAPYVRQTGSGMVGVFELLHPTVANEAYLAGNSITITAIATRANTTTSKVTTIQLPLQSTGTGNCNGW
jgi:hypothetical protein